MSYADDNFDYFVNRVGASEIATREALRIVENWILKLEPRLIIEIGSGIGTITRLVAKVATEDAKIIAFEKNSWCRDRFTENLSFTNILLISNFQDLVNLGQINVDLLIVDDFLDLEKTDELVKTFRPKVIFIEGHRRMQQLYFAKSLFRSKIEFKYRNNGATKDSYKGGVSFVTSRFSEFDGYAAMSNTILILLRINISLVYSKIREIRAKIHVKKFLKNFKLR